MTCDAEHVRLRRIEAGMPGLSLLLEAGGEEVWVHVAAPACTGRALTHLMAARRHRPVTGATGRGVRADLLVRCLETTGAVPAFVLVRDGAAPSLWLQVDTDDGRHEFELDVLDAYWLLVSGSYPVLLERGDPANSWDRALRDLLQGG